MAIESNRFLVKVIRDGPTIEVDDSYFSNGELDSFLESVPMEEQLELSDVKFEGEGPWIFDCMFYAYSDGDYEIDYCIREEDFTDLSLFDIAGVLFDE